MLKIKKLIFSIFISITCFNIVRAQERDFKSEVHQNQEKMEELQQSENKVNTEIAILEKKLLKAMEEMNDKQRNIDSYENTVKDYENKIHNLNCEIETLNNEITELEENISLNSKEILKLEEEVQKFKDVIAKRVKNLYMNIDTYNPILKLFFTTQNVTEFSDAIVGINKFVELDKNIIKKVLKDIDDIKLKNQNVVKSKELIQEKIGNINKKIEENDQNLNFIEEQKVLKQKELEELNELRDELQSQYDNLSDEKKQIQQEIIELNQDNLKLQEEIKKHLQKLNENNNKIDPKVNYGSYLAPIKGKITSSYGERVHPVSGKKSFHTGLDIAGNMGEDVLASLSGKVVSSGWYNSVYGNVVILNHGNNIQTFYAHMSETLVKVGQEVKRGDVIGKVGSTGLSTGPHLHFEIRINGEHVDPTKRINLK